MDAGRSVQVCETVRKTVLLTGLDETSKRKTLGLSAG